MKIIFVLLSVMVIEMVLQQGWIGFLNRRQVTLAQKAYGPQQNLEIKGTTPSMGGAVFILTALLSIPLIVGGAQAEWSGAAKFWFFPVISAAIGFADDWIKFNKKSSEGFPSLYKLAVQIIVVVPWAFWISASEGISLWPQYPLPHWISVPLTTFLAIGMLNGVNVTDGLDGLAAGACVISMSGALLWLPLEGVSFYAPLAGLAITAAFLWHNAFPARVFMGDVGSHFIAGLIVSTALAGKCLLALIPLGFLFGLEILSVTAQLGAIYGFKKKVFLMSPVHHHFQLLGWKENHIVTRFWMVHGVGLLVCALTLASFFGEFRVTAP